MEWYNSPHERLFKGRPPKCSTNEKQHSSMDPARHLIAPLRANGSLTSMTVAAKMGSSHSVLTPSSQRMIQYLSRCTHNKLSTSQKMIQYYCLRNQWLPILLSQYHGKNKDRTIKNKEDVEHLKLFPSLFAVAQHAPRTTTKMMLTGLLSASISLGPNPVSQVRLRQLETS